MIGKVFPRLEQRFPRLGEISHAQEKFPALRKNFPRSRKISHAPEKFSRSGKILTLRKNCKNS